MTWIKAAGLRAVRTAAQTALALIPTSALIAQIDWALVGSATALAALLSLLTSVASTPPEVTE